MNPERDDGGPAVVVDVAVPVPLRQTFTYRVPPDLDPDEVRQGCRALVPFRAKLLHGVTVGDARPAQTELDGKARFLAAFDGRQRILSPEIQRLVDWVVHYYKAPIGEAIKMALPPGVLSEKDVHFQLSKAGEILVRDGEAPAPLAALAGRKLSRKAWTKAAAVDIKFRDIREWEDKGLLELAARGAERESTPHETVAALTEMGRDVEADSLKRAPKQRQLLLWLRRRPGGRAVMRDINNVFGNGSALTTQLEIRGLCERLRLPKHELERVQAAVAPEPVHRLTDEQDAALERIAAALDGRAFQTFLLFGVTGGGKTEVYLRAIQRCLAQGRQALFLVPEIGLTPMMRRRIVDRFGERLAILHSAVGAAQRAESWAKILAGKVDVVLGARSGIFAPLPRLGLLVVDEEHDQSYKQNDGIRYQARDLALMRAKMADAVAVLGSATPSLESWHNCASGRGELIQIRHRATNAPLPNVEIVDMREEFQAQRRRATLSRLLLTRLRETLDAGHQAMVLLNRRGYHSFLLCRKCGETVMCSRCEVSLTYHQTDRTLKCHYCGLTRPVPPSCPTCATDASLMQFFGEGTQQLQELLQQAFPKHRVDRLDRDRIGGKDDHHRILAAFEKRETDILAGTQMIAKGHDFPNVTLVGIVNADSGLRVPDFRCAETTFQLVTQVAGRSGRGQTPGTVVIQTYMPEHYSIQCAAKHDYPAFLERELRYRESLDYAPFAHLVSLLVTDEDLGKARDASLWMAEQLDRLRGKAEMTVLGPAKAPIGRIKDAYRFQIVLKGRRRAALHRVADAVVEETVRRKILTRQAIIFDIDPYQFF